MKTNPPCASCIHLVVSVTNDLLCNKCYSPDYINYNDGNSKPDKDNDWYERGGYPPVGTEFEFSSDGKEWSKRVMLFNDYTSFLISSSKQPLNRWHYRCGDITVQFRPIQTERERWIEKAKRQIKTTAMLRRHCCLYTMMGWPKCRRSNK